MLNFPTNYILRPEGFKQVISNYPGEASNRFYCISHLTYGEINVNKRMELSPFPFENLPLNFNFCPNEQNLPQVCGNC